MARSISPKTDQARRAIARQLRRARKSAALSYTELAALTKIDRATLCDYENELKSIPSERLVVLAKATNTNVAELLNLRLAA